MVPSNLVDLFRGFSLLKNEETFLDLQFKGQTDVGLLALKTELPFSVPIGAYEAPLPGGYSLN